MRNYLELKNKQSVEQLKQEEKKNKNESAGRSKSKKH